MYEVSHFLPSLDTFATNFSNGEDERTMLTILQERAAYTRDTTDKASRRLDIRFTY